MKTAALTVRDGGGERQVSLQSFSLFTTAMSMDEAREQHQLVRRFIAELLTEGIDYGVVPGTGKKPVLLKPGAEHLCQLFRLRPEFRTLSLIENFETGQFFYRYACDLIHVPSGTIVGSGIGSCTTWESKYRFRSGSRKCPACDKETIIKGREEYGGGWLCFAKKGGCGAKFSEADPAITGQSIGDVPNDKIHDQVNTVDKMAQKRALIAATLITCGVSEYFTQDIEEGLEPETTRASKEELEAKRLRVRDLIADASEMSGKDFLYCIQRFSGNENAVTDDLEKARASDLDKWIANGVKIVDRLRREALAKESEASNG